MASFQLQTQHLPAVISGTASLSHSMSAFWHPRHQNGWWEEREQGEGHLFSDWQPRSSEGRPGCFFVLCSYILNLMVWLPIASSYVPRSLFLPSDEYRQPGTLTKDLPCPISWFKLLKRTTAFHSACLPTLSNLHWCEEERQIETQKNNSTGRCMESAVLHSKQGVSVFLPISLQFFPLLPFSGHTSLLLHDLLAK